jgi:HAD superfamily hydrolase (TIGR01509 family)
MRRRAPRPRYGRQVLGHVVVDLDGVLVDSSELEAGVLEQRLASAGFDIPALRDSTVGKSFAQSRRAIDSMTETRLDDAWWMETDEAVRAAIASGLTAAPGAGDLVDGLNASGITWCVATNSRRERARLKLSVSKLSRPGDGLRLIAAEDLPEAKPSPRALESVCRRLGARTRRMLVIDDDPDFIETSERCGGAGMLVDSRKSPSDPPRLPTFDAVLTALVRHVSHDARGNEA